MTRIKGDAAAQGAVADLQDHGFGAAKQAVDVARFILSGEPDPASEALIEPPAQATFEPSSDTVQKPASE